MTARHITYRKKSLGFTLIEMMIVTAIIGVLTGIAVPFFLKFQFDAQEAEGTQMLMAAWRDQQRVASECSSGVYSGCGPVNKYTDALDSTAPGIPYLFYRPASRTVRFNLITGSTAAEPGKTYSLRNLGYQIINYPVTSNNSEVFGMKSISVFDPFLGPTTVLSGDDFIFGAEAVLNGKTHLLAITAAGNLLKVCDAWTGQPNPAAFATVTSITGASPNCATY